MYASILFAALLSTLWTLKVQFWSWFVRVCASVCAPVFNVPMHARPQGGMYAVVYTDALQSVAMIVGLVVCIAFAIAKLDGGSEG